MSFLTRYRNKAMHSMDDVEASIEKMDGVILPDERSRERLNVEVRRMGKMSVSQRIKMFATVLPAIRRCIKGNKLDVSSLSENPKAPKTIADPEFIKAMEKEAMRLEASSVGYVRVPRRLIFKNKGIMYANAIVLTMEMDKDAMSKAPSFETLQNVMLTYADLGDIVVKLAEFLRKNGYGAHGSPALGGMAMYPVLAQLAGMGVRGRHGLLISPHCGPRQRIAAIFTSIENLPVSSTNPHEWARDFCAKCGRCIKKCPAGAIYEKPVSLDTGESRYIDSMKCLDYFGKNFGCSVCIKECPFNTTGYDTIKAGMDRRSRP